MEIKTKGRGKRRRITFVSFVKKQSVAEPGM